MINHEEKMKESEQFKGEGDYTPTNCRWATMKEQAQNRRKRGTVLCQ